MSDHFAGKTVPEHLKEARKKGLFASQEIHGTKIPGHLFAAIDSAKDTAFLLSLLALFCHSLPLMLLFAGTFALWKTGKTALIGWNHLERMHRLIEEERWEIEHHREQEKAELIEMYQAKGVKGKLLDDLIAVLMADDNRLLQIMLEEELALPLEQIEHPLKQACGAFVASLIASALCLGGFFLHPFAGFGIALLVVAMAAFCSARLERNRALDSIVWNCALAAFGFGLFYLLYTQVIS